MHRGTKPSYCGASKPRRPWRVLQLVVLMGAVGTVVAGPRTAIAGGEGATGAPSFAAPPSEPVQMPAMSELQLGELLVRQRCSNCHGLEPGEQRYSAPLSGLIGRKPGSVEGYTFSPVIKRLETPWTFSMLDSWLAATTSDTPDIRMRHVGIEHPQHRAAVIAYLRTLPGNE